MRVLQLGNGGGLDFNQTNSSFLIEVNGEYILFDCGFNVMERLLKLEKEDPRFSIGHLDNVYISHNHMDHIGNLESLIYYKKFVLNNKPLNIFTNSDNCPELKKFLPSSELKSGRKVYAKMCNLHKMYPDNEIKQSYFKLEMFETYHPGSVSAGIIVSTNSSAVMITGDTKAVESIETLYNKKQPDLIFHDYSEWDNPSRNVHACDADMKSEYSLEFKEMLIPYHTGKSFKEDWYDL